MDALPTVAISAGTLRRFIADIFVAAGCDAAEAGRIGHHLVGANLAGHDSHGVIRVPRYVQWLGMGRVRAGQQPTVVIESATHAVVDGNLGFGQTIGPATVDLGIAKARAAGHGGGDAAEQRTYRADRRLGGARGGGRTGQRSTS